MTRAQTVFVIALSIIAVLIGAFAVYVAGSTMWANRWYERGPKRSGGPQRPGGQRGPKRSGGPQRLEGAAKRRRTRR